MKKKDSASFSCTKEMLAKIDQRAESLGLSRSAYLAQLVRKDLEAGGGLAITPSQSFTEDAEKLVADVGVPSSSSPALPQVSTSRAEPSAPGYILNDPPTPPPRAKKR